MNALVSRLLRPLSLVLAALALSSCAVIDDPYYSGGGYSGGGGYYDRGYGDDYYYSPGYRPSYYSSVGYNYYYGGHYYRDCPVCHHHPCTCSRHRSDVRWLSHDRDNDRDHGRSDRDRDRNDDAMKLVRYRQDDHRNLPSGYHSADWYKKRGYSLKQNTYVERDGDVRGRTSSNKKDNDRHDNDRGRGNDHRDSDHNKKKH